MSIRVITLLLSLLVSLTACDRFMKGNKSPATSPIKIQPQEFSCLTTWGSQVKKYFRDELNIKQTSEIFECVDGAITTFKTFARGSQVDVFSSDELRQFLNRYLVQNQKISESFMAQLMKLKLFLIGGSETSLTNEEFKNLKKMLNVFKEEALQLRGFWKALLLEERGEDLTDDDIKLIHNVAKTSLLRVVSESNSVNSNYSFNELKMLIEEASTFMGMENYTANLKKWFPVVAAVRSLFIGDDKTNRSSTMSEWYSLMAWFADAYAWMSRFNYHILNINTNLGRSWTRIFSFVDMGLKLIETSPQMNSNGLLPIQGMDKLVDEVIKLGVLPFSTSDSTVKDTLRHLIASIIQGKRLGSSSWQYVKGIETADLEFIRNEYNIWKSVQTGIIRAFGDRSEMIFEDMLANIQKLEIKTDMEILSQAWREWVTILKSRHPLIFDTRLRLTMPTYATGKTVSIKSMSLLNELRMIVRLALIGYGVKRSDNPWQSVMTQSTMSALENDFRNFAVEIHFLDKRLPGAGVRVYNEARYFTFSSSGGYELSATQLLEQIALMISGGMGAAETTMSLLEQNNCFTHDLDTGFLRPIANESCHDDVIRKNFKKIYSNLPALTREIESGHISLNQILSLGKQIVSKNFHTAGLIEFAEIRNFGGVMHYLEALFEVYDVNHDQYFSEAELLRAFPRFASIVEELSPTGSYMKQDAFLYAVYMGKIPKVDGIISGAEAVIDFTSFLAKKNTVGLGVVSRTNLLKVFTLIK